MNLCIKLPIKLKFKRFSKTYSKLRGSTTFSSKLNMVQDSKQFICGLKSLTPGFLSAKLVHNSILILRRAVGKGRIGWPRVRITFNIRIPKTQKSEGHRMGKGRGSVRFWGVTVSKGTFVFKIHKSSRKLFFFKSFDWTNIFSFYEWLETSQSIHMIKEKKMKTIYSNYFDVSFQLFTFLFQYKKKLKISVDNLSLFFKFFSFNLIPIFLQLKEKFKNQSKKVFICKKRQMLKSLSMLKSTIISRENPTFLFLLLTFTFCFFSVFRLKTKLELKKRTGKCKQHLQGFSSQSAELFLKKIIYKLLLFSNLFFSSTLKILIPYNIKKMRKSLLNINIKKFNTFNYLDNNLFAERSQILPKNKISYIVSLYKGLRKLKKRMPFSCEIIFVDQRNSSIRLFKLLDNKRKSLRHINQK